MPVDTMGQQWGINTGSPGFSTAGQLTSSAYGPLQTGGTGAPVATLTTSQNTAPVSALWYLLGIFIILVVLKYASEHEKAGMDPKLLGVGVWNLVAVTLLATLGIATEKILLNKYPIKGLTDLINVV